MTQENTQERPLVTFALFAYNQEKYIREAIEGAFAQTYEPLEIIISDDCSTDQTFEIMQDSVENYCGKHRVSLRKNKKNLGISAHINSVLSDAAGEIVVLAAGDDISLPTRTDESVKLICESKLVTSVIMSANIIDQDGKIVSEKIVSRDENQNSIQCLNDLLSWNYVTLGACRTIRKNLFTSFGPLREDCPTEDTPFLLRSLMVGTNILSSAKGVLYRRHDQNLSSIQSLVRMESSKIYEQYEVDVDSAEKIGALSHRLAKNIRFWIKSDQAARHVSLKALGGAKLTIKDIVFIVRHPKFGLRDSLSLIFKGLGFVR